MIVDSISIKLTQQLVDCNIIKSDDSDIYMYGLQLLFSTIFKFSGLFILAWLTGWVAETAVFAAAFGALRVNAGGYHSDTYLKCFLMTAALNFSAIAIVKLTPAGGTICFAIGALITAVAIVLRYAPVDTPNKPVTVEEYPVYRRRSIWTVMIESIVISGIYLISRRFLLLCNIAGAAVLFEAGTLLPLLANKKIGIEKKGGE